MKKFYLIMIASISLSAFSKVSPIKDLRVAISPIGVQADYCFAKHFRVGALGNKFSYGTDNGKREDGFGSGHMIAVYGDYTFNSNTESGFFIGGAIGNGAYEKKGYFTGYELNYYEGLVADLRGGYNWKFKSNLSLGFETNFLTKLNLANGIVLAYQF